MSNNTNPFRNKTASGKNSAINHEVCTIRYSWELTTSHRQKEMLFLTCFTAQTLLNILSEMELVDTVYQQQDMVGYNEKECIRSLHCAFFERSF